MTLFARGLLKALCTRLYFDGEPSNETDPLLCALEDPAARRTLLAVREPPPDRGPAVYRFDLVLQGPAETVFLDL